MIRLTTELDGPLFRADIRATVRDNARAMLDDLVTEGAGDVARRLRAGSSGRAEVSRLGGRVADRVGGRIRSIGGRPWERTGVVSINARGLTPIQGAALMAAASIVERRTGAFRRGLGGSRAIGRADLLRGLR